MNNSWWNTFVAVPCQGKYDEAGPLYERSLAIREKALGPDHLDVATALNNRAGLLRVQVRAVRRRNGRSLGSQYELVRVFRHPCWPHTLLPQFS